MKLIILLLAFPYIFSDLFGKELEAGIFQKDDEQFMFFRIGQPPQFFRVKLDTTSFHLWLLNVTVSTTSMGVYDPKRSLTGDSTENSIYTTKERGNEVKDIIYLRDEPVSKDFKFSFVLLNNVDFDYTSDGILGLAMSYPGMVNYGRREVNANPRFSLVEFLYTNQLISSKIFSIRYEDNNRARLLFGSEGNSKARISYCSPDETKKDQFYYNTWNCAADGIKLANGNYVIEFDENKRKMAVFDSSKDHIEMHMNDAQILFDAIKEMTGGKCKEIYVDDKGKGLFCSSDLDRTKLQDLYFHFGEISLKMPAKELFKNYYLNSRRGSEEYGFLFKIFGIRNFDFIFIGVPLMKYYHLVFNMEKQRIGFGDYVDVFLDAADQNRRFPYGRRRWRRRRGYDISFIILMLVLAIIAGAAIYYYMKKRKMKKKVKGYNKKERLVEPIGTPMVNMAE